MREGEIVLRPLRRLSELAGNFHHATAHRVVDQESVRVEMEEAVAREVMGDRGAMINTAQGDYQ